MARYLPPELAAIARRFAHTPEFASSPLYQALSGTVARSPGPLRLAARDRPGQYPTFLFFRAVHALLLAGPPPAHRNQPAQRCSTSAPISRPRSPP